MSYLWDTADWTFERLDAAYDAIEEIALQELQLNIYRNQIEIISSEQMLDAYTSVGMPIYYNHWSFGKRFTQEWNNYKTGRTGLAYELVINSNPCINYLMEENTMTTQALVLAHAAFGHNHFFKNNHLFKAWTDADGIVDYLIFAKDYIAQCEEKEGRAAVESFLDSCHALMDYGINRYKRPAALSAEAEKKRQKERSDYLETLTSDLDILLPREKEKSKITKFPEQPEENILYFCEKHSPSLKLWQREIIRIIRRVAQYFYPQGQTKVMNEGFASWTHYTIMNRLHEKGLITDGSQIEFLALHSNVLYQPPWNQPGYYGWNPYKLGFEIFKDIERICIDPTAEDRRCFPRLIGEDSAEVIKDAVENYRDESFIRQYLSPNIMRKFGMFQLHDHPESPEYIVSAIHNEDGYDQIKEKLAAQYEHQVHIPHLEVVSADPQTRVLIIQYTGNGRRLELDPKMLFHLKKLWGFRVEIRTPSGTVIAKKD